MPESKGAKRLLGSCITDAQTNSKWLLLVQGESICIFKKNYSSELEADIFHEFVMISKSMLIIFRGC